MGRPVDGFNSLQAGRFTGCTGNQLRYWDKIGLVKPSIQATGGRPGVRRYYSFRDLIALKVVKSLLDGGLSLQRVRRAFEYLRDNAGLEEHLSSVKLVTDGQSVFKVCRNDVVPGVRASPGPRQHVVDVLRGRPAVLALEPVPDEDRSAGQAGSSPVRNADEVLQTDHRGDRDGHVLGVEGAPVLVDELSLVLQDEDQGPTGAHDAERFVGCVQYEGSSQPGVLRCSSVRRV